MAVVSMHIVKSLITLSKVLNKNPPNEKFDKRVISMHEFVVIQTSNYFRSRLCENYIWSSEESVGDEKVRAHMDFSEAFEEDEYEEDVCTYAIVPSGFPLTIQK